MKQILTHLLCYFMMAFTCQVTMAQPDKKINLPEGVVTGHIIVKAVKDQTASRFNYGEAVNAKLSAIIKTEKKQFSIKEALDHLERIGVGYEIAGEYITLGLKQAARPVKPGKVTGRITDEENGATIEGAVVRINDKGVSTDTGGLFSISLAKGRYEAVISYLGYGTKRITDITVKEGETQHLNIPLKRGKGQLGEVTVFARRIRESGTVNAMLDEIRRADGVVNGISREQIARSQDRTAAEVVRRIPGVSVIENRFIVIRGLPQRYNNVLFNNVTAPSFEADSRAFSFETVPSGMIDRVMIYKTAVPELPGDFAGGVVKIYTTDIPQKNNFKITYQASVRPNTTFREFWEQKQGSKAWLGYDDGTYYSAFDTKTRVVNTDILIKEKEAYWQPEKRTAPIDNRFNLEFARIWKTSEKSRIGLVAGGGYSNTYQTTWVTEKRIQARETLKKIVPFYTFADKNYQHEVRVNALANISLELNEGKHLFAFKNLYTHLGSFQMLDRKGMSYTDANDGIGYGENMLMKQQIQGSTFKGIYTSQLSGKHQLFKGTNADWTFGYIKSVFKAPDERSRLWTTPRQGNQVDSSGKIIWEEPYNVEGVGNSIRWRRNFIYLPEETRTFAFNISSRIELGNFKPLIKAGGYFEKKAREFSFNGVTLNDKDRAGTNTEIHYLFFPTPEGIFDANSNVKAGYIALDLPITTRLKLYGGLRLEDYKVNVNSFSARTSGNYAGAIHVAEQKQSLLPSANLTFSLSANSQLRAAYSKTLNRAEFRELAATQYIDMRSYKITFGNPDLKPQIPVQNIDLRYELYPSAGELFSLGLFYKYLDSPPELYNQDLAGSGNTYFWGNASNATVYGAELELMLSMGRFVKGGSLLAKGFQKISLMLNATYTLGSVNMRDTFSLYGQPVSFSSYVIKNRLMAGQSHYLINAGANFTDNDLGLAATLAFNVIGKRIVAVGSSNNPNTWEMPRPSLDFTFSQTLYKNLEIKGGVQNILNSRFRFMQDANYDGKLDTRSADLQDNTFNSWYEGTCYTIGFGLKL